LAGAATRIGLVFAVTHTYSGYRMVRRARVLARGGALGTLRLVQIEYAQGWLATPLEDSGQKQAAKRNTVHFAIRIAAATSIHVVGCGLRGRSG